MKTERCLIGWKPDANKLGFNPGKCAKAFRMLLQMKKKVSRRIIELLIEERRLTVTEIYIKLRLEQSIVSQHINDLRRFDVVVPYRSGKEKHYTLNSERLEKIQQTLESLF